MRTSAILRGAALCLLLMATVWDSRSQSPYQPKITLASPEAASLGQYGNVDVNLYTGQPGIEVPLLSAKLANGFVLPLKISYGANGLRPNEEASNVGLGWSLQCGGSIVRSVRGMDDLFSGVGWGYANLPIRPYDWWWNYFITKTFWEGDEQIRGGVADFEPDIFVANFLGRTLKFMLKQKVENNGQIGIVPLEKTDMKIKVIFNAGAIGQQKDYIGFEITDESGTKYTFLTTEHTTTRSNTATCAAYSNGTGSCPIPTQLTNPSGQQDIHVATAWHLDVVELPNHEQVTFQYDSYRNGNTYSSQSQILYSESKSTESDYAPSETDGNESSQIGITQSINQAGILHAYLKKVSGPLGSVVLETSDRADLERANDNFFAYGPGGTRLNPQKLDKIILKNSLGQTVNQVRLNYDYFNAGTTPVSLYQRLKLVSIDDLDAGNTIEKSHAFQYNELLSLPAKTTTDIDHWGFFNNIGNTHKQLKLIPTHLTCASGVLPKFFTLPGANREPNGTVSQSGQLTKIIYPTGGATNLEWEANTYRITNADKKLMDKNAGRLTNPNLTKYGSVQGCSYLIEDFPGEYIEQVFTIDRRQQITFVLDMGCVPSHGNCSGWPGIADGLMYVRVSNVNGTPVFARPASDYKTNNFRWVHRVEARDLDPGTYSVKIYKMWDAFCAGVTWTWQEPAPEPDPNLYTTQTGSGLRIKTIRSTDQFGAPDMVRNFKYETTIGAQTVSSGRMAPYITYTNLVAQGGRYYHFATGTPQITIASAAQGNSIGYDVVDEEFTKGNDKYILRHRYMNFPATVFPYSEPPGLPIYNYQNITGSPTMEENIDKNGAIVKTNLNLYNQTNPEVGFAVKTTTVPFLDGTNKQIFSQYRLFQTNTKIAKTTTQLFPGVGNPYTTETEYKYNGNNHNQVTEKISKSSKNETISQRYWYPSDTTLTGAAETARLKMIEKNQIDDPVQEKTTKNSNPIQYIERNYEYNVATDLVNLKEIKEQGGAGTVDLEMTFDSYDAKGNITQYTGKDGIPVSFIYDYNLQYPVAEVKNAVLSDIAYTSFEADNNGGWNVPTDARGSGNAVTGNQWYPLHQGAITKSDLNTATTYIVSFWAASGTSVFVSGEQSSVPVVQRNGYTYWEKTVSGVNSVQVSGTGGIDELRLYPRNALMSTATFDRLLGQTSICDPSGHVIYYEYDNFGRLKLHRDQNRNVVRTYDYQYRSQP